MMDPIDTGDIALAVSTPAYTELRLSLAAVLADDAPAPTCHAVAVDLRDGGILLAVPASAVPPNVIAAAEADGTYPGVLGPIRVCERVRVRSVRGAPVRQTCTALLVDLSAAAFEHLTAWDAMADSPATLAFARFRSAPRWPAGEDLLTAWEAWNEEGDAHFDEEGRLTEYESPFDAERPAEDDGASTPGAAAACTAVGLRS